MDGAPIMLGRIMVMWMVLLYSEGNIGDGGSPYDRETDMANSVLSSW